MESGIMQMCIYVLGVISPAEKTTLKDSKVFDKKEDD